MAQKPTTGLPGIDFITQLVEMQKDGFAPLPIMAPVWAEATQDYMQEVGRFMAARLEKDLKAQQALIACGDFDDLRALQSDFVQETIEDYREEATRLSEIAGRLLAFESEEA